MPFRPPGEGWDGGIKKEELLIFQSTLTLSPGERESKAILRKYCNNFESHESDRGKLRMGWPVYPGYVSRFRGWNAAADYDPRHPIANGHFLAPPRRNDGLS